MSHITTARQFALVFFALHTSRLNAEIPLRKTFAGEEFMDMFCRLGNVGCKKIAHLSVALDFFTDSDPANGVVQCVFIIEVYDHN